MKRPPDSYRGTFFLFITQFNAKLWGGFSTFPNN
jgi:hypothetical protein